MDSLCARGIKSLTSVRETVGTHITLALTGDAEAFNFLADRFAGKPAVQGCSISDVVNSLADPVNTITFGKTLVDALQGLLGLPLGFLGPL